MKVILVNNSPSVIESFQLYLKFIFQAELFIYPNIHPEVFEDGDTIFLCEPIEIENTYYSVFSQWCLYIRNQGIATRIIKLTDDGDDRLVHNPFRINLVDSHMSLHDKLEAIFTMPLALVIINPEESPFEDIGDRLKTFFRGHGQGSLIKNLTDIYQDVHMAPVLVAQGDYSVGECIEELIRKRAAPRWEAFKEKYQKYLAYFCYLPYYNDIRRLVEQFRVIDNYFLHIPLGKEEFIHADIRAPFSIIRNTLEDIDRLYIGSERPLE